MNRKDVFEKILDGRTPNIKNKVSEFAPINIAVIKYWGKRNTELILPFNSSLSFTINDLGCMVKIEKSYTDEIFVNGKLAEEKFFLKTLAFVDLWRSVLIDQKLKIEFEFNVPIGAGLASSSAGFAALTKVLDAFFGLNLNKKELSILARMGSGSACRSVFEGMALWQRGERDDGMDSFATEIECGIKDICIGFIEVSSVEKDISSTKGMQETVMNSPMYDYWPKLAGEHLKTALDALKNKDFMTFGSTIELNCLLMHSCTKMMQKPCDYLLPKSFVIMKQVQNLRIENKIDVYFTADAGPNIKLIFLEKDLNRIKKNFPLLSQFLIF